MKSFETILEGSFQLAEISNIAKKIAEHLKKTPRFCLWLQGDLGAGKTTMTRAILQALGLDSKIPVQSPTFMYMLEYKVNKKYFFHMDLYRIDGGDFANSLGIDFLRDNVAGLFIEWPEKDVTKSLPPPTHSLQLEGMEDVEWRSFKFLSSFS